MTTTSDFPDFRALCEELAVDLEEWMVATDHRPPSSVELLNRARAALAAPPPEPPADEEPFDLWQHWRLPSAPPLGGGVNE